MNNFTENSLNVPKLRFPEFKGEWVRKKLGEVLEFKNGINANKEQYGSGYKFINVLDILNNDFITYESIIGSVNIDEELFNKFSVEYGDILFQRSSETREEVGTANVYLDENKSATFGGFVIRGKKIGEYEPVFLNTFLKTDLSREQITSKSGGSTRYNVGQEILASISLPFPSLPEQTRIASFFNVLDKKISELKQKKSLLEQYKKSVMQKLFSQELRFKDENGNEFPKWEKKKLGEVCECLDNLRKPINDSERQNMQGNIPYWGANNIMDYVNDYLFDETIVLLAEDGGNFDDYKERPIANISFGKCWVNNHSHVLKGKSIIVNEFLFYSLVHKNITGYVSGGTRAKLTKGEMLKIEILIPSVAEQTRIANFLSAIDEKINNTENQIQQTQLYKKGLLQNMFC